jgi:hypothetical protein
VAVKFLLDENLPKALARALRRRARHLDVLRVHDAGLGEATDPEVLEFAAAEGRVLVSRDKRTLRRFAKQRIEEGKTMTGLLVVRPRFLDRQAGLGVIVAELALIAEATSPEDWHGVEQFVPYLYA